MSERSFDTTYLSYRSYYSHFPCSCDGFEHTSKSTAPETNTPSKTDETTFHKVSTLLGKFFGQKKNASNLFNITFKSPGLDCSA